jgi:hypothetical protein
MFRGNLAYRRFTYTVGYSVLVFLIIRFTEPVVNWLGGKGDVPQGATLPYRNYLISNIFQNRSCLVYLAGGLAVIERGVRGYRAGTVHPLK